MHLICVTDDTEKPVNTALRGAGVVVCVIMLLSLFMGYGIYHQARATLEQEFNEHVTNITLTAANLTDADAHDKASENNGRNVEQLQAPYRRMLQASPDVNAIYTIIQTGDAKSYAYVLYAELVKAGEVRPTPHAFTPYPFTTPALDEAFRNKHTTIDTQKLGTVISGYTPLYDSTGTFVGVVAVDIATDDLLTRQDDLQHRLLMCLLISFAIALVCGACFWRYRQTMACATRCKRQTNTNDAHKEQEIAAIYERQKQVIEQERRNKSYQLTSQLQQTIDGAVQTMSQAVTQLQHDAQQANSIAAHTRQNASIVMDASQQSTESTAYISTAAEQLTMSIREISKQTNRSSLVAKQANTQAQEAKQRIENLSTQSAKVENVITIIMRIARQINMLAMNATIEAARAGESGRGFAVVANEVKTLATQVASATDQITSQIQHMREATNVSVDSVQKIMDIIQDVAHSTDAVAAAVEEQSAVTNDIAQNIIRSSAQSQRMSESIAEVQRYADQSNHTAEHVLHSAHMLGQQMDSLRHKLETHIRTLMD